MDSIRVAAGCVRCPTLVDNRQCIVHGYGAPDARVLFIGEAPGYKGGDLTGVPFTRDRSGVRLQRVLIELGLSYETMPTVERPRLHCFLTNIVRCNPPANRTPTRSEITSCEPYLWQEIDLLCPEFVVPLGNIASRTIFPRLVGRPALPITHMHARVFARNGVTVVPMRHPARISNADLDSFVTVMQGLLHS